MSLQAILQAMEAEAAQREHGLLADARALGETLLKEAADQSASARRALEKEATVSVRAHEIKAEADAQLRVAAHRAEVRDAQVHRVFARAEDILRDARADPSYPAALAVLFAEALAAMPVEWPARLRCDPRDVAIVAGAVSLAGRFVALDASLKTWGGVVVEDVLGRLSVDNTLERRLERAAEQMRAEVGRLLAAPLLEPSAGLEGALPRDPVPALSS